MWEPKNFRSSLRLDPPGCTLLFLAGLVLLFVTGWGPRLVVWLFASELKSPGDPFVTCTSRARTCRAFLIFLIVRHESAATLNPKPSFGAAHLGPFVELSSR